MMRAGLASLAIAIAVVACAGEEKREPETAMTPASSATQGNDRSIQAITEERCQRESRCGNVGADETYASEDDCRRELNQKGYDSLGADECPSGVHQPALQACLASIRAEDCGAPLDSLERMVDCRSGKLCAD
jgi:hypothetical protein